MPEKSSAGLLPSGLRGGADGGSQSGFLVFLCLRRICPGGSGAVRVAQKMLVISLSPGEYTLAVTMG